MHCLCLRLPAATSSEYDDVAAVVLNSPLGRYRYPVWVRVGTPGANNVDRQLTALLGNTFYDTATDSAIKTSPPARA